MSGLLQSSKVIIVEEEPRVRGIPSAPTSVAGAVGITERGPLGEAVLCSSFDEYQAKFGDFTADSDLALAAMGFYENGGSQLWVVRTAHYADAANPATTTAVRASGFLLAGGGPTPASLAGVASGPFALQPGDSLRLVVDGAPAADAVFEGTPASLATTAPGPFVLTDGMELRLRVDGGTEQSIRFSAQDFVDLASATPSEVAAAINDQLVGGRATSENGAVVIASDTAGTSSRVQVTGGAANAALAFPAAAAAGSGNVGNLRATQLLEVKTLVEAAVPSVSVTFGPNEALEVRTSTLGVAASLQASGSAAAVFGFDPEVHRGAASGAANALRVEGKDPGSYANRVEVEVRASSNGSPNAFDLLVLDDGVYKEAFPNLSLTANAARYAEKVVNDARSGSVFVRLTDQLLPNAPTPGPQSAALAGGSDGLIGLDDSDFVGSAAGKTGLRALDRVQELSILLVPGRATPAVHHAMIRYCEGERAGAVFAVLDPPANQSAAGIVSYLSETAALEGLSEYAAIYWPRLRVLNPTKSVFGAADQLVVPPSASSPGSSHGPTRLDQAASTIRRPASTRAAC